MTEFEKPMTPVVNLINYSRVVISDRRGFIRLATGFRSDQSATIAQL